LYSRAASSKYSTANLHSVRCNLEVSKKRLLNIEYTSRDGAFKKLTIIPLRIDYTAGPTGEEEWWMDAFNITERKRQLFALKRIHKIA
jgi:predicted DNA-binding transcriptional regulator YafY